MGEARSLRPFCREVGNQPGGPSGKGEPSSYLNRIGSPAGRTMSSRERPEEAISRGIAVTAPVALIERQQARPVDSAGGVGEVELDLDSTRVLCVRKARAPGSSGVCVAGVLDHRVVPADVIDEEAGEDLEWALTRERGNIADVRVVTRSERPRLGLQRLLGERMVGWDETHIGRGQLGDRAAQVGHLAVQLGDIVEQRGATGREVSMILERDRSAPIGGGRMGPVASLEDEPAVSGVAIGEAGEGLPAKVAHRVGSLVPGLLSDVGVQVLPIGDAGVERDLAKRPENRVMGGAVVELAGADEIRFHEIEVGIELARDVGDPVAEVGEDERIRVAGSDSGARPRRSPRSGRPPLARRQPGSRSARGDWGGDRRQSDREPSCCRRASPIARPHAARLSRERRAERSARPRPRDVRRSTASRCSPQNHRNRRRQKKLEDPPWTPPGH